jgi:co-chaperonin GroES (HSP10)
MTDLILPPGITLPKPYKLIDKPDENQPAEQKAKQLPDPVGYKLLCIVPDIEETFEGTDIVRADSYRKAEEIGTTVLFVLKVGALAYADKEKFPTGPWCKQGDFILVRTYTGTRIKIHGKEFRIINDDQVDAVVEDPRGISRAAA